MLRNFTGFDISNISTVRLNIEIGIENITGFFINVIGIDNFGFKFCVMQSQEVKITKGSNIRPSTTTKKRSNFQTKNRLP